MASNWTSRKRVEAAIQHQEPDRVPIDMTLTVNPYLELMEYFKLEMPSNIKVSDFTEVRPDIELLEKLGVDITWIKLSSPKNWTPPPIEDGISYDQWGIGRKEIEVSPGIFLNEIVHEPLKDATLDDLEEFPWPDPEDPGRTEGLAEEARMLYEGTDLAIMGRFGGTLFETAANMRGWEQWMIDLGTNRDFIDAVMDKIVNIQMRLDERGLRAAGKYLTIFKLSGDDFGIQNMPLYSMKMWREIILPVMRKRWLNARRILDEVAPHVKLMMHSDGAIRPYLPDMIDSAIDILDPIQRHCPGMDVFELKRDFGDQLTFHGAVDTQNVMPFGTTEDVKQEVITCLKALAPGGGYICAPVHNVQGDVSAENLVAMCEAVHEYGQYPIKA